MTHLTHGQWCELLAERRTLDKAHRACIGSVRCVAKTPKYSVELARRSNRLRERATEEGSMTIFVHALLFGAGFVVAWLVTTIIAVAILVAIGLVNDRRIMHRQRAILRDMERAWRR